MRPGTLFIEQLGQERIAEIERRMGPGKSSRAGFLGPEESLREVIREDERTLLGLGVSHGQIAQRLVEICQEGMREWKTHPDLYPLVRGQPKGTLDPVATRWVAEIWKRKAAYVEPDYFRFHLETMRPLLLPSGFGFAYVAYMGYQYCPFGDQPRAGPGPFSPCGATDCDFLVTNPRSREWIAFSGLLPHLIEAHHFFEGHGTIYRLDPERAVRVLELGRTGRGNGDPATPPA